MAIQFDDGWKSAQLALPILDRYRFKATFWIIAGKGIGWPYMDWDEVQAIAANPRYDVQSHTMTHPWKDNDTLAPRRRGKSPPRRNSEGCGRISAPASVPTFASRWRCPQASPGGDAVVPLPSVTRAHWQSRGQFVEWSVTLRGYNLIVASAHSVSIGVRRVLALFLRRRHHLALAQERGRGIVIEGRDSEDASHGQPVYRRLIMTFPA